MNRHRAPITPADIHAVTAQYCFLPIDEIGHHLGRTGNSVLLIAERLKLPTIENRNDVLTVTQFSMVMGLCRQAGRRLAKNHIFSMTMYNRNRKVTAIDIVKLKRWLSNPENWCHFDRSKVAHKELRKIVYSKPPVWLSMEEAGKMVGYSYSGIVKLIRAKRLPARWCNGGLKGRRIPMIHIDDLNNYMKELNNG